MKLYLGFIGDVKMLVPYNITNVFGFFGVALLSILIGSLVAYAPGFAVLSTLVAFVSFFVLLWFVQRKSCDRIWVLCLGVIGLFILPFIIKFARIPLFGLWQVMLFFVALMGVKRFLVDVSSDGYFKAFLVFFIAFLVLACASSVLGRSKLSSSLFQLLSDLKPVLLVVFGYVLLWDARSERLLWQIVDWYWVVALMLIAFEWAAPGMYLYVFASGSGRLSPDPTGLFPSRAIGSFEHPSFLASVGSSFCVLCFSRFMVCLERRRWYAFLSLVYLIVIVCSVQRQELAGAVVSMGVAGILSNPRKIFTRTLVASLCVAAAGLGFWLVFSGTIERELGMWGVGTVGPLEHPRAQIFSGALSLAVQHWPLGSGLGTYAGAGAERFDRSLYDYLGFSRYWWYGKEDYLMDTYWPNSIAETGFLGAALLLFSYLSLGAFALRRCLRAHPEHRLYWVCAAALMVYMLGLSLSSPSFQDPRLFLIPAMMFGISSRTDKEVLG